MQKLKDLLSNKTLIISLAIPALIIVLYVGILLPPQIRSLVHLLPKASRLKREIVNLKKDWANINSLNKKILQLYEKLDYYERKLPDEKEIPAILEYLSDSAKDLNVKITEIKPIAQEKDTTPKASAYYQVPILLLAECGYHQLGRFLNKLENADRFMKIEEIKIARHPTQSTIHPVRLTIITYVMKK